MNKFNSKIQRVFNIKLKAMFGGHPAKLQDVEYNPDNVKVHQNDVTPEMVEQHRDIYYENRPQDINHNYTNQYVQKFLNSSVARNEYFVGFLKNVVQGYSITEMRNSKYINPPKLHDNSVFICQSQETGQLKLQLRQYDGLILGGCLFLSMSPIYHLTFLGVTYYTWARGTQYYLSKSLVIRMDLLPQNEQISVVRVGFNGQLYNKLYNIDSLKHIEYDELIKTKNILAKTLTRNFDVKMIFQDSETGDYLLFDNQTVWSKEGLEHPLISSRN